MPDEYPDPPPKIWPLAAAASTVEAAIWPPPPTARPTAAVRFRNNRTAIRGTVSDMRTGTLSVYREGITLVGNAVLRAEVIFWIEYVAFFLVSWVIAALILEYIRPAASLTLKWDEIELVGLIPKKRRVCVVYRQTDKRGRTRKLSLATSLSPTDYEAFTEAVVANAPHTVERKEYGNFAPPFLSPDGLSLGLGWLTYFLIVMVYAAITAIATSR
jgi:hypothetical protein